MSRNKGHPKEKKPCGAKKKNGELCKSLNTYANSRCKFHGGMTTGAPKGNQNAVKHGKHSNLLFSSFTSDQIAYIDEMSMDTLEILENEIKVITMRELMMLDRMKKLEEEDYSTITIEETQSQIGNRQSSEIKTTKESNKQLIVKMQEAITKVQLQKLKMLNQKAQLESQRIAEENADVSNIVQAITQTSEDVWSDEHEEE